MSTRQRGMVFGLREGENREARDVLKDYAMDDNAERLTANEVLVFDSSTFIEEAGLTSRDASTLRHYLHVRRTQLAMPQVVAEECERKLRQRVVGKATVVRDSLGWLARFFGSVNGWAPPPDGEIDQRVKAAARGEGMNAVVVEERPAVRRRAEERHHAERPPSHVKDSLQDCRIWEQCVELLRRHDVIFVSRDSDFRGHRHPAKLHPQLREEVEALAGGGRLTFHPDMDSLLSGLRAVIPPLPAEKVFSFVYDAICEDATELETNSGGCRPTMIGTVVQKFFTTDQADTVEVRLKVYDQWKGGKRRGQLSFRLSGTCRYRLSDRELCDLSVANLGLYETLPDGSERAIRGSVVNLSMSAYAGVPPIVPEPEPLRAGTDLA